MDEFFVVLKNLFSLKGLILLLIIVFFSFLNNVLLSYLKYDIGFNKLTGTFDLGAVLIRKDFIMGYLLSFIVFFLYNLTPLSKIINNYFSQIYKMEMIKTM